LRRERRHEVKRITLDFQHAKQSSPFTAAVSFETDTYLVIIPKWGDGREIILTKRADGTFVNENHVVFVRVAVDRRRKLYSVKYSGIDGTAQKKFATLADVQEYVKGRWEGVDYIDSADTFHNDYGRFTLTGCKLSDLGSRIPCDDYFEWHWSELATEVTK
jgi:hypothetical protein